MPGSAAGPAQPRAPCGRAPRGRCSPSRPGDPRAAQRLCPQPRAALPHRRPSSLPPPPPSQAAVLNHGRQPLRCLSPGTAARTAAAGASIGCGPGAAVQRPPLPGGDADDRPALPHRYLPGGGTALGGPPRERRVRCGASGASRAVQRNPPGMRHPPRHPASWALAGGGAGGYGWEAGRNHSPRGGNAWSGRAGRGAAALHTQVRAGRTARRGEVPAAGRAAQGRVEARRAPPPSPAARSGAARDPAGAASRTEQRQRRSRRRNARLSAPLQSEQLR